MFAGKVELQLLRLVENVSTQGHVEVFPNLSAFFGEVELPGQLVYVSGLLREQLPSGPLSVSCNRPRLELV